MPLPEYVDDIQIARYIGITTRELYTWPTYMIDQYRAVRAAEYKAREMANPQTSRTGR